MATYSPNASEIDSLRPSDEDEVIDIRVIFAVLHRWWREIALLTAIVLFLGTAAVMLQRQWVKDHPIFEAAAQVTVARVTSDVSIDDTFQTQLNGDTTTQDNAPRRAALLGLIYSGSIAKDVIADLSPMLDGQSPSHLLNRVQASYVGEGVSDLLEITVVADTPEKAAAIANSWAQHYVEHINALYGEIPDDIAERVQSELVNAQTTYEDTQQAYEQFLTHNDLQSITRQIEEKQQLVNLLRTNRQSGIENIINQTSGYQQEVVKAYLDAVQQNRLLAFTKEQEANRLMVSDLIDTISANRRLAFTKEHEARVQLFNQYADLELQNRLLAMSQENNAKAQLFQAYSEADIKAKLVVFNQQVNGKVGQLIDVYATKQRLEQLLDEARALQQQIEQAGEAGAKSNSLPIMLLKLEAYAATASSTDPLDFQLDLSTTDNLETDPANQLADLAALVETVEARIVDLDTRIGEQSQSLINNEGFQLLDGTRPEDDELYAAIQEQYLQLFNVGDLARAEDGSIDNSALSQAITAKYDELFTLGPLTDASLGDAGTTSIYKSLEARYPDLFAVGDLAELADGLFVDSPLEAASQQKIDEMLQPLDLVQGYLETAQASEEPILNLEEEIKTLQANQENQTAQRQLLLQRRDLALEAFNTLNNKLLELTLQRAATNREVRLASSANPPDLPEPGLSLYWAAVIGVLGFCFALVLVFFANTLNVEPFLARRRQRLHPAPLAPGHQ